MAEVTDPQPNPLEALASTSDLPQGTETRVSMFVQLPGDGGFHGFALNPGSDLANDFRQASQAFAQSLLNRRTMVAYVAGRKPDDYELAWLTVAEATELGPIIERAEDPTPMELFDPGSAEARHLRLSVVSLRKQDGKWSHFVREASLRSRLARSGKIAAIMGDGAYDRLETDVLLFDRHFDAIVSRGLVFLVNQRQFERATGFTERAGEAARSTLQAITAQLRINNLAGLLAAAATDTNMVAKLRGIQAKMSESEAYAKAMTMPTLVTFLKARPELQIDLEGPAGKEALVFYPDPPRRWRILKLLDDDYLHSQLTQIDYEANSKSVLK
jgi:hypothetical protein